MRPVISAWMHCTQLICQQLRAEQKKKKKKKEKTREMRNAAVDVESKHIQNKTRLILIGFPRNEEMFSVY